MTMQTAEQLIRESMAEIERQLKAAQQQHMTEMTQDFQQLKSTLLTLPTALTSLSEQQAEQLNKYSTIADVTKRMDKIDKQQATILEAQKQAAVTAETITTTLSKLRTELASFAQLMKRLD